MSKQTDDDAARMAALKAKESAKTITEDEKTELADLKAAAAKPPATGSVPPPKPGP